MPKSIKGVNRPWSNTFGMVRIENGLPKKHQGVDLFALPGTPVYACVDGIIVRAEFSTTMYGNIITIKAKCSDFVRSRKQAYHLQYANKGEMAHGSGFNDNGDFYFMYAHLSETDVHIKQAFDKGERVEVKAGDKIGKTGTSGFATTKDPHLHFEILNVKQKIGMENRVNPGFYVKYKLPDDLQNSETAAQHDVAVSDAGDLRQGDPSIHR